MSMQTISNKKTSVIATYFIILISLLLIGCSPNGYSELEFIDKANKFYERGDNEAGLRVIEKEAYKGNPVAKLKLAEMYFHGEHVEKNEQKEAELFKQAIAELELKAAENDPVSTFMLGEIYNLGINVDVDKEKADKLFSQVLSVFYRDAHNGNHDAEYYLGLMNEEGYALKKDPVEAMRLYKLAADHGNTSAKSANSHLKMETDDLLVSIYSGEKKVCQDKSEEDLLNQ